MTTTIILLGIISILTGTLILTTLQIAKRGSTVFDLENRITDLDIIIKNRERKILELQANELMEDTEKDMLKGKIKRLEAELIEINKNKASNKSTIKKYLFQRNKAVALLTSKGLETYNNNLNKNEDNKNRLK